MKLRKVLFLLTLVVSLLYVVWGLNPDNAGYNVPRRLVKLAVIFVTGAAIGYSTIVFQTVVGNRILTSAIMGLDSLYLFVQTLVVLAMVIAQDSEYILIDEPLNNLDMKHSVQIMGLLPTLVDDHGKTVVLVLHDINFAAAYSDFIISLKDGKLLKNGTAKEVITSEELKKVYDMDYTIHEVDGMRLCAYFK